MYSEGNYKKNYESTVLLYAKHKTRQLFEWCLTCLIVNNTEGERKKGVWVYSLCGVGGTEVGRVRGVLLEQLVQGKGIHPHSVVGEASVVRFWGALVQLLHFLWW